MSPHDTLRDRLTDAAAPTGTPLPNPRQLRTRAVRHRNQRRAAAGSVVLLAAAAVAVAGSTLLSPRTASIAPAVPPSESTQTADPTPTAAPTTEPGPAPSGTQPPSTGSATAVPADPPVTPEEARAFVEDLRFELEDTEGLDPADEFAPRAYTDDQGVLAHGCLAGTAPVEGVLAMRTATLPGPDRGLTRQVSVFADPASAASAFAEVRTQMRACHTERAGVADGVEVSFVGEQLALGDESFWVGTKDLVVDAGSSFPVGEELYFSTAAVMVLDENVITVIDDPASGDDERAEVVAAATAEWERLRERYQPVLP